MVAAHEPPGDKSARPGSRADPGSSPACGLSAATGQLGPAPVRLGPFEPHTMNGSCRVWRLDRCLLRTGRLTRDPPRCVALAGGKNVTTFID
jgi:hypothetical protein